MGLFSPHQCCWSGSHFCFNEAEKFRLFSMKLILVLFHHWGFFPLQIKKKGSLAVKTLNIRNSFSVSMFCNLLSVWPLTSHLLFLWFNFPPLKRDMMLTFTHPLCLWFNLLTIHGKAMPLHALGYYRGVCPIPLVMVVIKKPKAATTKTSQPKINNPPTNKKTPNSTN